MSDWDGQTERRMTTLEMLTKMQGKIDILLTNQASIKEQVVKTNGRVTALERFEYTAKGVIAVIILLIIPITLKLIYLWMEVK